MTSQPGLCLVGAGAIALDHMAAFDRIGLTDRRCVVSRRLSTAQEFAKSWQFAWATTDLADALTDPGVELVLVTSPNDCHAEQASLALRAGKHVMVEIPLAMTLVDAQRLAGLAATEQRRLFACHTMRSFRAIREVRRRVCAGEFDVRQIVGFFAIPRRSNEGLYGPRTWSDNLLWHHACHQVDAALWVLGTDQFDKPAALLGAFHPVHGMAMDLTLSLLAGSTIVTQSLTYNASRLSWELRFIGRQDFLTFRNGALLDETGAEVVPQQSVRDLYQQNADILRALASGSASEFDVDSVLPAMRVLDQLELKCRYTS